MMTRKEHQEYCMKNKDALMFLFNADQDYVAARCCILNGLVYSGLILAAQAIEKNLKTLICFESGEKMKTNHNPYELKEKLKQHKDYKLDKYNELLKKLFDHYQNRYSDNSMKYGTNGGCSDELVQIDELLAELKEKLPIPNEVKYRTRFFSDLFEHDPYWNNEFWLRQHNPIIASKTKVWEKEYKKMRDNLYSDFKK